MSIDACWPLILRRVRAGAGARHGVRSIWPSNASVVDQSRPKLNVPVVEPKPVPVVSARRPLSGTAVMMSLVTDAVVYMEVSLPVHVLRTA